MLCMMSPTRINSSVVELCWLVTAQSCCYNRMANCIEYKLMCCMPWRPLLTALLQHSCSFKLVVAMDDTVS